jgi:hypothetical protein
MDQREVYGLPPLPAAPALSPAPSKPVGSVMQPFAAAAFISARAEARLCALVTS